MPGIDTGNAITGNMGATPQINQTPKANTAETEPKEPETNAANDAVEVQTTKAATPPVAAQTEPDEDSAASNLEIVKNAAQQNPAGTVKEASNNLTNAGAQRALNEKEPSSMTTQFTAANAGAQGVFENV